MALKGKLSSFLKNIFSTFYFSDKLVLFSSPGRSPGIAIVLPPALVSALALASALAMLKFLR